VKANPEKVRAVKTRWRTNNPDKARESVRKHRDTYREHDNKEE